MELLLVCCRLPQVIDGTHADLELVLSSGIGDHFPVVYSLLEAYLSEKVAEDIFVFLDVDVPLVGADLQAVLLLTTELLADLADIPRKSRNDNADDLTRISDRANQIVRQLTLVLLLALIG